MASPQPPPSRSPPPMGVLPLVGRGGQRRAGLRCSARLTRTWNSGCRRHVSQAAGQQLSRPPAGVVKAPLSDGGAGGALGQRRSCACLYPRQRSTLSMAEHRGFAGGSQHTRPHPFRRPPEVGAGVPASSGPGLSPSPFAQPGGGGGAPGEGSQRQSWCLCGDFRAEAERHADQPARTVSSTCLQRGETAPENPSALVRREAEAQGSSPSRSEGGVSEGPAFRGEGGPCACGQAGAQELSPAAEEGDGGGGVPRLSKASS